MSKEALDETGTLYKKLSNGEFDINGNWTAEMDDFIDGYPTADYSDYKIGTNGALYGPMGNLRISLSLPGQPVLHVLQKRNSLIFLKLNV